MRIAVITDKKIEFYYDNCDISFFATDDAVSVEEWKSYTAAILLEPYGEKAVISWTGHTHLRSVNSIDELRSEIASLFSNLEVEKKYLIAVPDIARLNKYHPFKAEIEQIYLTCLNGTHRIRRRVSSGIADYYETLKIRITGTVCREFEEKIDEETYIELQKRADPKKHPIRKNRYCFLYKGQYFELDIYEFWKDKATLEIELRSENQSVELPEEIEVIKDVSNDYRYKNNHLAGIAYEDY